MRNKWKIVFSSILAFLLILCIPTQSMAYYCTSECYNVCGLDPFWAGQCSKEMECPEECTGHHVLVLDPAWTISEPTCTQTGQIQTEICDAVSTLGICHQMDKFEDTPALGHDYGPWKSISATQHERKCKRDCNETGWIQTENHTFDTEIISYKDNGDTHITTYKNTCNVCGYTYTETKEEPHVYKAWIESNSGHTADRVCKYCAHEQNESINITAEPLSVWNSEHGVVKGESRFWNHMRGNSECGTPQAKKSEYFESKNMDTNETSKVGTSDSYTEYREGRYTYTYSYTDMSNHKMKVSLGELNIDHSAPQITVKVNCGGTDNIGTKYTDNIEYVQNITTHGTATGAYYADTKWTNIAPKITVSATDYLKDTNINGSGVHSVIIYDEDGYVVGAGSNSAFYQLTPADEGTHIYTIVATDNLCRKAYEFKPWIKDDNTPLSYDEIKSKIGAINFKQVYNATGANTRNKYQLSDWCPNVFKYDINHITVSYVITHFDCTASMMIGVEDLNPNLSVNVDDTYYLDLRTVYVGNNIITEYINDFCNNSTNHANDSSDIAKIIFNGYDKDNHETLIASAIREDYDSWKISQSTNWSYYGSGLDLMSCNRHYSAHDILNMEEDGDNDTISRSSSSISNPLHIDTDTRYVENFNGERIKADPVTEAMLTELLNLYEYYTISVMDVAGNKSIKRIVPEYAELRTFHTTIDPSSYKDPITDEKR